MSNISTETYQVIKALLAPPTPTDAGAMYTRIVEVMKEYVKPKRSALVYRYKFDNQVCKSNEMVAEYVKVLKHLATDCKFSDEMRQE